MRGRFRAAAVRPRPTALAANSPGHGRPPTPLLPAVRFSLRVVLAIRDAGVFNHHVAKFFRIEDFAALQALDKLSVFESGDDSNLGMFTGGRHRLWGSLHRSRSGLSAAPSGVRRSRHSGTVERPWLQVPSWSFGPLRARTRREFNQSCTGCSFRQIVAFFGAIANQFFGKVKTEVWVAGR
jgi:hypothetical protein